MQNDLTKGNENKNPATLIYCLYLVGILFPLASIIGVVVAYVNRSDAADWLQQHYRFQIRTFWIGFLVGIVMVILMFFWVGYLIYPFLLLWLIIRCAKGLKTLGNRVPPKRPGTWLF